jgi:hypothetical protein
MDRGRHCCMSAGRVARGDMAFVRQVAQKITEPLELAANDDIALSIDTMDLKNRLRNIQTDCRNRLHGLPACAPDGPRINVPAGIAIGLAFVRRDKTLRRLYFFDVCRSIERGR